MDIDLNIATSNGSISVENTGPSSLLVRISNGPTLREVIRKRAWFERVLQSHFGHMMLSSFDAKVNLDGKTIVLLEGEKITKSRRWYLGWQYLLTKLGF